MKKLAVVSLVLLLAAALVTVLGCGSTGVTVQTTQGKKATTPGQNGGVKVTGENGETTVTTKNVTEAEIGMPVYPGAQMDENSSVSASTKNEKGETTWSAAVLWTPDAVSKVVSWYRGQLSGKPGFRDMSTSAAGEDVGFFIFQSGNTIKTVTIGKNSVDHPGTTSIAVATAQGAEVTPPAP